MDIRLDGAQPKRSANQKNGVLSSTRKRGPVCYLKKIPAFAGMTMFLATCFK